MIQLLGLAISIGLVDSLNPSTIAPALYLASSPHARRQLIQFVAAVFVVYFLGGAIIALGPGELLMSLIPHPSRTVRHLAEVGAGATLVVVAVVVWARRGRLGRRDPPKLRAEGRSAAVLGATIMAVELPTAFPYFAVIAALVASGLDVFRRLFVLGAFNLCFVLPLLLVLAAVAFGGKRAERVLAKARELFERRWPQTLAVLLAVLGLAIMLFGVVGVVRGPHHSHPRHARGPVTVS